MWALRRGAGEQRCGSGRPQADLRTWPLVLEARAHRVPAGRPRAERRGEGLLSQASFSQGPESSMKLRTDCLALSQSRVSRNGGERTVAVGLS